MQWTVYLNLFGLTLEIVAAFILAIESIGLDRVSRWAGIITALRHKSFEFEKDHPPKPISIEGIVATLPSGATAFAVASFFYFKLEEVNEAINGWWVIPLCALVGGLTAGLLSLVVAELTVRVFKYSAIGLLKLELSTREGKSGVIGFLVLLIGFLLQFAANVAQLQLPSQ